MNILIAVNLEIRKNQLQTPEHQRSGEKILVGQKEISGSWGTGFHKTSIQTIHHELALKNIHKKFDWKQNRKSPRELK